MLVDFVQVVEVPVAGIADIGGDRSDDVEAQACVLFYVVSIMS